MKRLLFVMTLVLAACVSRPVDEVNYRINQWQSVNIDQLIRYWGLPTNKKSINQQNYAEWINQKQTEGNTAVSIGSGHFGRRSSIGVGVTLFDLGKQSETCHRLVGYNDAGKILSIEWSGDRDYCYQVTPDRRQIIDNQR